MLNPRIRANRLRAEYDRVRALHDSGGLIQMETALGDPPDRYLIRYTCRGIAQVIGDQPLYSNLHRVALVLTSTYPTERPQMEWLTPIFHPNISTNGESVCIGEWYPAKTLDQLLIMLGEMIQYKNYGSYKPLHLEASLWTMAHRQLFPVDARLLLDPDRTAPVHPRAGVREGELDIRVFG
jgi:ubiquitin-protein ligase